MTTASLPSISHLWRQARAWLAEMLADFISPARVARAIGRTARIAFRKRLQRLELLVLKLLLIEAARLPAAPRTTMTAGGPRSSERSAATARPPHRSRPASEDRRLPARLGEAEAASLRRSLPGDTAAQGAEHSGPAHAEHRDHPVTWRVRFHTPGRRQGAAASTPRRIPNAPACAQTLALRLARRFEALRRVIADPRRAIAALARKLHALGARARALARRIALMRPRRGGGAVFAQAIVAAYDASHDLCHGDSS